MKKLPKYIVSILICYIIFFTGCTNLEPKQVHMKRPAPVQRGELLRFGNGSIQNVKEITMKMEAMDFAVMAQAGTVLPVRPPQGYPAQLSWRPLRHFGPFFSGSDITQIQLVLNAKNAGWFYQDFLTGHEDSAIFKKYYGANLPSTTPAIDVVPGTYPNADGFNDIRMKLHRIKYTNRYGGSVQLQFRSDEDYEVEVRKGTILWELNSLIMRVYVVPIAGVFNPNYPINAAPGPVYVEFIPGEAVAYDIVGDRLNVRPDNALAELTTALGEYAPQVASANFNRQASRFVYGFVHSQFKDYIAATDKVNMIKITNDFLDLQTRDGEVTFHLNIRISDINLDTEWGDEEIIITISAEHVFDLNNRVGNPTISYDFDKINNREGTPFRNFGVFKLEQCTALDSIIFLISVLEDDDFPSPDDTYDLIANSIAFECGNLQSRANNGDFGIVSENATEGVILMDDDNVEGALSFVTQVQLLLR
jgi:hypothetical protein